jgi:hypothetical protein
LFLIAIPGWIAVYGCCVIRVVVPIFGVPLTYCGFIVDVSTRGFGLECECGLMLGIVAKSPYINFLRKFNCQENGVEQGPVFAEMSGFSKQPDSNERGRKPDESNKAQVGHRASQGACA